MPADDAAQGEHVGGEKSGAKHRALGDTAGDTVGVWFSCGQGDVLGSAGEVRGISCPLKEIIFHSFPPSFLK